MKRAEKKLVKLFLRNGCMRYPNEERQKSDGVQKYKKGYEVRWTAVDRTELTEIKGFLEKAGFVAGNDYPKRKHFIQPVYGKDAVFRFQELLAQYQPI